MWDVVGPVLVLLLLWLISLYCTLIFEILAAVYVLRGVTLCLFVPTSPIIVVSSPSWSGCERLLDPEADGQST